MCRYYSGSLYEPPSIDLCAKVGEEADRIEKMLAPETYAEAQDAVARGQARVQELEDLRHELFRIEKEEGLSEEDAIIQLAGYRVHPIEPNAPRTKAEYEADQY